ncbi:MAG: hypothetical protein KAT05_11490 [Spirochaetes bacterium]|nr:hypothetical protein [Spirochaetota bacterium]
MKKYLFIIYLFIAMFGLYSASVNVDELNIIADGHFNPISQSFEVNTYFKFITSFDGGYKFAAQVAFEANTKELETNYRDASTDFYNKVFMLFRHAEVCARNLADSHLSLSFWTGTHKYLGSGNKYKGYLYYPNSVDVDYQGFYRLRGTGISTQMKFWQERFRGELHFYENTNFITSQTPNIFYIFSFDTQIGLYFEEIPIENDHFNLFIELFGGVTFPISPYGQYKVGMSFGVGNDYVDFFVSAGLPKMDANITNMTFDDIYLAADLHFKLFVTDHTISFLTRPLWYNEQKQGINNTGEKNDFDINYKFNVIVPDFPLNGGFILNFQYSLNNIADSWNLYLSPFIDIAFSGVIWNISVHYDFSRINIAAQNSYDYKIYLEGFRVIIGAASKF